MTSIPTHAIDLLRSGRVEDAERVVADLPRDDPAQPDALHPLGIVRHTQGRSDEGDFPRLLADRQPKSIDDENMLVLDGAAW